MQRRIDALAGAGSLGAGLVGPIAGLLGLPPVTDRPAVHLAGLGLAVAGLLGTFAVQLAMGASWRIGVDAGERTELVTSGVFRWVRNPIMTGTCVTFAGITLLTANVVALTGFALVVIGAVLLVRLVEEPYLVAVHGDDYREYARRTGRFLPSIRSCRRPRPP